MGGRTTRRMTRRELEQDAPAAKASDEPGNEITGPNFGDVAPADAPEWLYPTKREVSR